jgi:predicted Fe-Mo cluster-binding NifX family protein
MHLNSEKSPQEGGVYEVNVRIVVPVSEEKGIDSRLSQHFGRAPFYAIIDLDERGKIIDSDTIVNTSEHFGGIGLPPDRILQLKPKALVTYGLGSKALAIFQNANVAVLRTEVDTVREVVNSYNNNELQELTDGCHQSHNH